MSNRKLIRPSLTQIKEQMNTGSAAAAAPAPPRPPRRKPAPSHNTNAENFYYVKQIQNKTPMIVVLQDGETIKGTIDWYDKNSVKVNRGPDPDLLVLKHYIKYMFKENEDKEND